VGSGTERGYPRGKEEKRKEPILSKKSVGPKMEGFVVEEEGGNSLYGGSLFHEREKGHTYLSPKREGHNFFPDA